MSRLLELPCLNLPWGSPITYPNTQFAQGMMAPQTPHTLSWLYMCAPGNASNLSCLANSYRDISRPVRMSRLFSSLPWGWVTGVPSTVSTQNFIQVSTPIKSDNICKHLLRWALENIKITQTWTPSSWISQFYRGQLCKKIITVENDKCEVPQRPGIQLGFEEWRVWIQMTGLNTSFTSPSN